VLRLRHTIRFPSLRDSRERVKGYG